MQSTRDASRTESEYSVANILSFGQAPLLTDDEIAEFAGLAADFGHEGPLEDWSSSASLTQDTLRLHRDLEPESPRTEQQPQHSHAMSETHALVELAARQVTRRQAKLAPLRQEVQLLRDRANYEWEARTHERRHVRDSQKELMEELAAVFGQLSRDPAFSRLQSLYQQCLGDQQALADQIAVSRTVENELSSVQYRMMTEEKSFTKSVKKLLEAVHASGLDRTSSSLRSGPASQSPVSQIASPPELHPLLADCYDKVGDVKLARERIAEIVLQHEEEQISRKFREDQGRPMDLSDETFFRNYERDVTEAGTALSNAVEAAEIARRACLESGFDVTDHIKQVFEPTEDADAAHSESATPYLPDTASVPSLEFPVMTPGALPLLTFDNKDGSSAEQTAINGPPNYSFLLPRSTRPDKDFTKARLDSWVHDVRSDATTSTHDDDTWVQETVTFQDSRPLSVRSMPSLRPHDNFRSVTELTQLRSKSAQLDATETITLQHRLRTIGRSPSTIAHRLSDSELSSLRSRHDSHQDVLEDLKTNRPP